MHIQDRSAPNPPISTTTNHHRSTPTPTKSPNNPSPSTPKNLSNILLTTLLTISAVAAILLLLLPLITNTPILCFPKSPSSPFNPSPSRIHLPSINFNSIPLIPPPPSDPFSSLRADRWIVIAAPSRPSPALLRLSSIPNWQLLAVATSQTPLNFSLSNAVVLSLDLQSRLNFRSAAFLPRNSHVRKSLGYLFAVQHGARVIYDADARSDVMDVSQFDLQLSAGSEIILQYSHHDPNRTVVNPYIHFGQHSVWPRGFPLDRVSVIEDEEFYTEVFGGHQFIQQGLSDGLPDVDSVFYFTRKSSGLEAFDIRFDGDAPKVALPQGIMVPVNCFNTLFHSQAFWALMLPASVSSMASDVLRGYWGQRMLWEIGGHVVVYPPTVRRVDDAESYPFAEEKDLHVNVGRLIEFLMSWRSDKQTLFERILHLSYAMAENGFWSESDVRFTAAWLQDLLAVGYQQPRLMSLELDRPRATIGHGDRKEFYPKKLPCAHLGVEEVGVVSSEIGNLIKWRKNFGNVVLVMHCGGPVDRTAVEWRLLYGRVFKTVILLAEERNEDFMVEHGELSFAYRYLPKIFSRYAGADGFIFLQDNMILNYWNLQTDKNKLWITNKVPESWFTIKIDSNSSQWQVNQASLVKQAVDNFPANFQTNFKDNNAEGSLTICGSEFFYIPRRLVGDFVDLVELVRNLDLHHIVAVPMFFMAMDSARNFDSDALSTTLYLKEKGEIGFNLSSYSAGVQAVYPLSITNESEFIKLVRLMASGDPLLKELV